LTRSPGASIVAYRLDDSALPSHCPGALTLKAREILWLVLLSVLAVAVNGYHIGQQDQAIYLPAIKKNLDGALYPFDADFFYSQTRWMLFDELVAGLVRLTSLPLDFVLFGLHLATLFLFLLACRHLAGRSFHEPAAQWAAVATVALGMLMPIAGTQLLLMERYLHPRNLATAALLFALLGVLDHRPRALAWIVVAGLMHPTMTLLGLLHLAVLAWKRAAATSPVGANIALAVAVPNPAWKEILATRPYLFPLRWHWYEWLGVAAPVLFLAWFARRAKQMARSEAAYISRRILISTALGIAGSLLITTVPLLEPLVPAEPMRILHLTSLFFVLFAGGVIGRSILGQQRARWAAYLVGLSLVMYAAHRLEYSHSPHITWPGRPPVNEWVDAFDWARQNTPRDAVFALDTLYLWRPGNDVHGFRGFAERSMLADWVKDRAVAALAPDLALAWRDQTRARQNWQQFRAEDFRRLKRQYGVTWVVLENPGVAELACPYQNARVQVCRIE
jgi:hypothetical protein